jgi:hypothetical protein
LAQAALEISRRVGRGSKRTRVINAVRHERRIPDVEGTTEDRIWPC